MRNRLVLSCIAVLSLSSVMAQELCLNVTSNCTGFYHKDINAAFVDCYDEEGALAARSENFYKEILLEECDSLVWSEARRNLTAPANMTEVEDNATVEWCDYFSVGEGYRFTQVDNGVGLSLVESRIGGARD